MMTFGGLTPVQSSNKLAGAWGRLLGLLGLVALLGACSNGVTEIGVGLPDANANTGAYLVDTITVRASTVLRDSVPTSTSSYLLAGRYTLLEQDCLAFLDRCARDGLAVVAAGVFNSGILAGNGKFNYADAPPELMARTETLRQLCHEAGVSLQAAALQFPMAHPAIVSVVVGARSAAQIVGNVGWFEEAIPDKFWQELRSRGLMPGLCHSNELIARDEGMHTRFACTLHCHLQNMLPEEEAHDIVRQAVKLEQDFFRG